MILKVNGTYLDGTIEPHIVRRAKTFNTLEDAGDFTYQFDIDDTAKNRRALGITDLSTIDSIYPEAAVESNGVIIHLGNLKIEGIDAGIQVSLFSGNTNWLKVITGFVYEVDLSQFKLPLVNTSPSATLVGTWDNTEGIIYPLVDRGRLVDWSNRRLGTGDFLAMTYLKNIVAGIFKHNGLKFQGELFRDALYNATIVGSGNPFDISFPFYDGMSTFPGKTVAQFITTSPSLITFPVVTYPFRNGTWALWDPSANRYTASQDVDITVKLDVKFAAVVTYTFELRINGVVIETITGTDSSISNGFNESNAIRLEAGDYFEIWASISVGAVNITSASLKVDAIRLPFVFPQYLLADMTQVQVIQSVFAMFNVIADYDPFSKTVTCNLFRNIESKEEQDLSAYIDYYTIDFVDMLNDMAQHNYFQYQESVSSMAADYRDIYDLDFGEGDLRVYNEGLEMDSSIDVSFTGSFDYYNTKFGANLMHIGIDTYDSGGEPINITSVTNDGGDALFTTDEPHGFAQLDYVRLTNMVNGVYHGLGYEGLGRISSAPSDTTFKLQHIDFNSAGTGQVNSVSRTIGTPNDVFVATVIPDYSVSKFSVFGTINYEGTAYSEIAYASFLRPNSGMQVDEMRESVAFGKPFGFTNITLLDKNYSTNGAMFNNPMALNAVFTLPENVYRDFDFSRPVRIKTKDFNCKFFMNIIEGYLGSHLSCEAELIKIS